MIGLGEYLFGSLVCLITVGAACAAAYVLLSRRLAYLSGLPRLLAFGILASGAVLWAGLLPAVLGILSKGTSLVAGLVLLAAALAVPRSRQAAPREAHRTPAPPSSPASIAIAVVAVGAVSIYAVARLYELASQPLTEIDTLNFHVPTIARFIQTGSVWRVDQFLAGIATAQYPNNGEFLILSSVLPWRDLAFVRFVPAAFYAFTGIATYALALELRATRGAAATLAAAGVAVPAFSSLAFEGVPDAICLATFITGLLFLVRHFRSARLGELMIAGLALGLALGTKWYGVTAVAVALVVWLTGRLVARFPARSLLGDGAALLGATLAGGGFWLVRNLVESGSPIYPKAVSLLGVHLFPGSYGDDIQRFGLTIARYLGHPHILRTYIYPAFKDRVGFTGIVLLVGLVLAAVASARSVWRHSRDRPEAGLVLALSAGALGIAAVYAITPGSAYGPSDFPVLTSVNIRWLMPGILIAAALAARAVRYLGRAGWLLELAALVGVLASIEHDPSVAASTTVVVAAVEGALLLAVLAVARRDRAAGSRGEAILAAVLLIAIALVLGRVSQSKFDRHKYARYDPTFAWIVTHAPSGHRVGVTGVWSTTGLPAPLPAFGPRLRNVVAFVGDTVRHTMHLPATESSFDREVRSGRFDLLLIGLQETGGTDVWARAAGYQLVARSPRLALYAAEPTPASSSR